MQEIRVTSSSVVSLKCSVFWMAPNHSMSEFEVQAHAHIKAWACQLDSCSSIIISHTEGNSRNRTPTNVMMHRKAPQTNLQAGAAIAPHQHTKHDT